MTDFEKAFNKGIDGLKFESPGFSYTCPQCLEAHDICCEHRGKVLLENGEIAEEGSFSHYPCDICGTRLGGERYAAHAFYIHDDKEIVHLEVCQDCVLYMANGDVPEDWAHDWTNND